jgi:hypothetical protein
MRPTLVINPVTDRDFTAFAERQLEEAMSIEDFQGRMRVRYPQAVVRPRQLAGESTPVWYVYRDGRWTNPGKANS